MKPTDNDVELRSIEYVKTNTRTPTAAAPLDAPNQFEFWLTNYWPEWRKAAADPRAAAGAQVELMQAAWHAATRLSRFNEMALTGAHCYAVGLEKVQSIAYRMARHIRNTDEVPPARWGIEGMRLLEELQRLDPEQYAEEVKGTTPTQPAKLEFEAKLLGFGETDRIKLCEACLLQAMSDNFVICSSGIPVDQQPAPTQPETPLAVTPESIVYGVAKRDPRYRKWLIEQLTALGDKIDTSPITRIAAPEPPDPAAELKQFEWFIVAGNGYFAVHERNIIGAIICLQNQKEAEFIIERHNKAITTALRAERERAARIAEQHFDSVAHSTHSDRCDKAIARAIRSKEQPDGK